MIGFLLFLTAVPLAALLALLLNTLLDRRTLDRREWPAPSPEAKTNHLRSLAGLAAVATALLLTPAPARATADPPKSSECTRIDCSLEADAEAVQRLWSSAPDDLDVIVAQSRIPVRFSEVVEPTDAGASSTADDRSESVAEPRAAETP